MDAGGNYGTESAAELNARWADLLKRKPSHCVFTTIKPAQGCDSALCLHRLSFIVTFMFDWLKRKKPSSSRAPPAHASVAAAPLRESAKEPATCSGNPGKYLSGNFVFTRDNKTWQEE